VPREFDDDEIVRWCTHAMIVESTRLLVERIAQRGSDIDAVLLNGYGFPRHRGGPLFHADALGLHRVIATMQAQAGLDEPTFWQPPALLLDLADSGQRISGFAPAAPATERHCQGTGR